MNRNTLTAFGTIFVTAAAALAAVSCSGGGSNFAGIDRLGISSGAITGFGSIFVNGVEWDTNGATITVGGSQGDESDLKLGQVVTVRGTLHGDGSTGDADSVDFENNVEGPIGSIDLAASTLVVLGQTVIVGADTEFDDSVPAGIDGQRTLADLNVDDVVEVSGYRDGTGAIRATRIEVGGSGEFEVRGTVSSAGVTTFHIGTLTVEYSGTPPLSDGDFVDVHGTLAGAVLTATEVQLEDPPTGESGEDSEVEGYVTRFVSATDFDVAGVPVTTDGGTVYEGGTSADLALNVKVEVEGTVNSSGIVVADEIDIRVQSEETDVEIVGDVDIVNAAQGTVTINGMELLIRVDEFTSLEDDSSAGLPAFSLADLHSGDHVRVRGAQGAALNEAIATSLKRENADDEVVLQGPVQAINEPDLSILGVQVAGDNAVFLDHEGGVITEAAFFATVNAGNTVVKARSISSQVTGDLMVAEELQLEEIDD